MPASESRTTTTPTCAIPGC